ncbi:MAG: MFS transporter [Candidatus Aenigmarchaeota archaeon]|nr:MFS transporter [Candidatus Aenigmarchaeota archaeon]
MRKKDDITKYYIFRFLTGINFAEAIFVLFLLSLQLNYTQFLITQSVFALTVLISQVPAGALSDLRSRKGVIKFGTFVGIIASLVMATSNGFYQVILAEVLFGVAIAFSFGTIGSFAYDTMIENKKESMSKKIFSRGTSYMLIGGMIGPLIGGLVANQFGLRMGMFTNIAAWTLMFLFSFSLKEPIVKRKKEANYFQQIKISYNICRKNTLLVYLIVNFVVIALCSWLIHDLIQPRFQEIEVSVWSIGLIFAGVNFSSAIISNFADDLERRIGIKKSILFSSILIILGTIIVGLFEVPSIVIAGFFLTRVFLRFREPLFTDYFNKLVGSDKRATVISFANFLYWFLFAIFGVVIGFFVDRFGLATIFLSFSVIMALVVLLTRISEEDENRLNGS